MIRMSEASGNASGTLTVTDGAHIAHILLLERFPVE
jgi:hypothetical protein